MTGGASADGCPRLDEVSSILERLLAGLSLYFDKGLRLNSDGRRALARAARACEDERLKRILLAALKAGDLDAVAKAFEAITGRDAWSIVEAGVEAWGRRASDGP